MLTHFTKTGRYLSFWSLIILLFTTLPVMAQQGVMAADAGTSARLSAGIDAALKAGRVGKASFYDAPGMRAFYTAHGGEPVWVEPNSRSQDRAESILEVLEDSWTQGLNPENYRVVRLRELLDDPLQMNGYELELLLSDAMVRYGRDLTGMRVDPRSIGQKSSYWRQPLRGQEILDYVSSQSRVDAALHQLEPQSAVYEALRDELVRLLRQTDDEDFAPIKMKGTLYPGEENKAVPDIRRRLGLSGSSAAYDDRTARKVMEFQREHGLEPDGVLGPQTVNALNTSLQDKIDQVLVNLERLRWSPDEKPERYVLVNIPAARLWAVEDGRTKLEMPVIVGKEKRKTVSFKASITGIRFNPTWTVPTTIKREDMLPKLQEDPAYLSKRGIELRRGKESIDPTSIDWSSVTSKDLNEMQMVQEPGRNNPLGRIRVIMPNPYDIYLHDTNDQTLFNRANRTLSSGCIRVSDPYALADFIMDKNNWWSHAERDAILASGHLTELNAKNPIPVYILYQTMWKDDRGRLVYGYDIYGEDRTLLRELKKIDGIFIPDFTKTGDESSRKTGKNIVKSRYNP